MECLTSKKSGAFFLEFGVLFESYEMYFVPQLMHYTNFNQA